VARKKERRNEGYLCILGIIVLSFSLAFVVLVVSIWVFKKNEFDKVFVGLHSRTDLLKAIFWGRIAEA
jgi:hypothetical protein